MERDEREDRRKRYYPQVSLGNILSIAAFLTGAVGVYATTYADAQTAKVEIANLKNNQVKTEAVINSAKQEVKSDIQEVKTDIREVRNDVQKILFELQRQSRTSRDAR